jgi:hypothetical protein
MFAIFVLFIVASVLPVRAQRRMSKASGYTKMASLVSFSVVMHRLGSSHAFLQRYRRSWSKGAMIRHEHGVCVMVSKAAFSLTTVHF